MKELRTIDLRLWLPLLVTLIIVILCGVWIAYEYQYLTEKNRMDHLQKWRENMARLQDEISHALLEGRHADAENILSSYGTDPGLQALAVIDANNGILLANRFAWKKQAADRLPGFDPRKAEQVRNRNRMRIDQDAKNRRIISYYPLPLVSNENRLRPPENGILYLNFSLAHSQNQVWQILWQNFMIILPVALLAIVLIVLILSLFISRPLRLLISGTQHLAEGRFEEIPVKGKGELARLARAFNLMCRQLKQTLTELHNREQRLNRTLESIGDAVITTDAKGRITRLNRVAEQLTGWSHQEAVGEPIETVFPILDARTREPIGNPVHKVVETGEIVELSNDTTLISREGVEHQIADSAAPILGDDNRIEGVILVFQDVSEAYQIREERRIAAIAFETHDAIMITDAEGKILRTNKAFTELTGYRQEEIVGKNPRLQQSGRHDKKFYAHLWSELQQNDVWSGRIINRHKEGHLYHAWETITAVKNEAGKTTHYVANLTDITELDLTTEALVESQHKYQTLIESMHDGVALLRDGVYVDCNDQLLQILGRKKEDVIGKSPVELSPPNQPDGQSSAEKAESLLRSVMEGTPQVLEWTHVDPEGNLIETEISIKQIILDGNPTLLSTMRDISERKEAERKHQQLLEEVKQKEELIRLATRASGVGTWDWNIDSGKVNWSEGVEEMFGLKAGSFGKNYDAYRALIHPEDLPGVEAAIQQSLQKDTPYHVEHRILWPDGSIHWLEGQGEVERDQHGQPCHMRGTVIDITERKQAQEEIERLAYYDPLTGLANRRLLLDRLQQAISHAIRETCSGAVIFLDLDRFKLLNDSLGHRAGDMLLKQVANRLTNMLREEDTVARLGGDEFVIMLPMLSPVPLTAAQHAYRVAEKIRHALQESFILDGHKFHLTASLGIALLPQDGENAELLLNHADAAMYQAKSKGRNTISYYHPHLQADADARLTLEEDLRHALENRHLSLHYQAQVNNHQDTVGVEALIRWNHPERGMVPPNEFIPVAEETGLILAIGEWVLLSACQQLRSWSEDTALATPGMSVNVSPIQFRHVSFVDQVNLILKRSGINPQLLTLEITEGTLIEDLDDTISKLKALKELGVRISIDDFGTGYSSLYYLKHLPLDELKIDKAYVQDITDDPNDAAIVETILSMARHLGLNVVAEGVETMAQMEFLRENKCHTYQGYLFSRPQPAGEFAETYLNRQTDKSTG